jgi:hypothetical protein
VLGNLDVTREPLEMHAPANQVPAGPAQAISLAVNWTDAAVEFRGSSRSSNPRLATPSLQGLLAQGLPGLLRRILSLASYPR